MLLEIKNHGPPSVFYWGTYRGACNWCDKPRVGDMPLRLCKGCSVSLYCSKECQSAAWPVHKLACKSRSALQVPEMYASLGGGCATMAGVALIGTDWTVAHRLSLHIIATILIEAKGGAEAVLATPHTLIVDIGPHTSPPDGTPATSFDMGNAYLASPDHDQRAESQWSERPVAYRRDLMQTYRATPLHPDHLGVVPVVVYFYGTPCFLMMLFHVYRRRGGVGRVKDRRTKAELGRLIETCISGINSGTVLRIPTDPEQKVPDLGRLTRHGSKGWAWTPYSSRAEIPMAKIWGSSSAEGFAAYHRLWPYTLLLVSLSS